LLNTETGSIGIVFGKMEIEFEINGLKVSIKIFQEL